MKEIIVIIRPKKIGPTKEALEELGIPSVTAIPVLGRGKQRGIAGELGISIRPDVLAESRSAGMKEMKYIPKRLLSIVACDEDVDTIVETIIKVNKTEQIGDGRIFICPVDDVIRIRTDEHGESAIN
jgi:nitrogen regulatory protein PII 2